MRSFLDCKLNFDIKFTIKEIFDIIRLIQAKEGEISILKEHILRILEENRAAPVSGQLLADQLSVSRAAVWKAMKSLEAEGHRILAVSNRGYRLEPDSDLLTEQGVRRNLFPAYRACPILIERCVESTNTAVKRLGMDGAVSGTLLLAEQQSAGRGRRGRSFFSPAETGLYMSLLLRPQESLSELAVITIAAATAVCESVEALTGLRPQIKWVNDILLNGRKISGILTEAVSDFENGEAECVIVGIGVNVKAPPDGFPDELKEIAGTLVSRPVSRNRLSAEIINRLRTYTENLSDRRFLDAYRERSAVLGKQLRFCQNGEWRMGTAAEIDQNGGLLIDTEVGRVLLRAGEIHLTEEIL